MYFVGLGVIFMVLKYLEIGPVALWDWWIVL
ncbi:MAG: TIGR04438 family Trp-rich protein, partial [Polaromonas sp.]